MSQGKRNQTYIERVPYEAQIEDQVRLFRLAQNENDLAYMQNIIEGFYDMVQILGDDNPDYQESMRKLEDEFNREYERKVALYLEAVKNANAPFVIPKPTRRMNRRQIRTMFTVLLKLCHDKRILITPKSEAFF